MDVSCLHSDYGIAFPGINNLNGIVILLVFYFSSCCYCGLVYESSDIYFLSIHSELIFESSFKAVMFQQLFLHVVSSITRESVTLSCIVSQDTDLLQFCIMASTIGSLFHHKEILAALRFTVTVSTLFCSEDASQFIIKLCSEGAPLFIGLLFAGLLAGAQNVFGKIAFSYAYLAC
ncbi:hypothetical protein COCNU_12G004200 [Cocos nucifera]|uniref:Uncharacterized protein n=1 Tax=Cocos nucifera TaxID=13894 RepID=A0A8K0NAK4_COCNU|nr:hypothetical protein COCNU_12G004200 [Cocos nucifera]